MKITHSSSNISRIDRAAVDRVLDANYVGNGPAARALEVFLKKRTARKSAFAVQSGFQALVLALRALDLPKGARVAIPALTCATVAAAIRNAGLIPLLVDIREDLTLDVAALPANCAAVIAPHVYGSPVDVAALKRRNIPWIEDCATSPATRIGGKAAGSFGTLAIFSFSSTKYITAGSGGALVCDNPLLARRIEDLLNADALKPVGRWKNNAPLPLPGRMNDLQAALALSQLRRIDKFLAHRRSIAKVYLREFKDCAELVLPKEVAGHSWYRFIVRTPQKASSVALKMKSLRWDVRDSVNPWLFEHSLCNAGSKSKTRNARAVQNHLLSLPIHMHVSSAMATQIARSLRSVVC